MRKLSYLLAMIFLSLLHIHATEPSSLLGKTLIQAIDSVPNLSFHAKDMEDRMVYGDGGGADSLVFTFVTFDNDIAREVCLYVESNDGVAYHWFLRQKMEMMNKNEYKKFNELDSQTSVFLYEDYSVTVRYVDSDVKGRAFVIYQQYAAATSKD